MANLPDIRVCAWMANVRQLTYGARVRVYTRLAEASNPSGGHCCQTYWGLFLRQPPGAGEGGG